MLRREGWNGDQSLSSFDASVIHRHRSYLSALSNRDEALRRIGAALHTIAEDIERHVPDSRSVLRHAQVTTNGVNVTGREAQI